MSSQASKSARQFCHSSVWSDAGWIATTFRCHPSGEAPPVMGIVFNDWAQGVGLFRSWIETCGNQDAENEIRIAIIEGEVPGQMLGYTVRISPATEGHADGGDPHYGAVMRMHPIPGTPAMLADFKRDYLRHEEFLLAPVVCRDDDQLWFNVQAGIIKHELHLRHVANLAADDPDAIALRHAVAMPDVELLTDRDVPDVDN